MKLVALRSAHLDFGAMDATAGVCNDVPEFPVAFVLRVKPAGTSVISISRSRVPVKVVGVCDADGDDPDDAFVASPAADPPGVEGELHPAATTAAHTAAAAAPGRTIRYSLFAIFAFPIGIRGSKPATLRDDPTVDQSASIAHATFIEVDGHREGGPSGCRGDAGLSPLWPVDQVAMAQTAIWQIDTFPIDCP